jgi:hypothetical protein
MSAEQRAFEFASGGSSFHPLGEWRVTLDARGACGMRHVALGRTTEYGPFALTEEETGDLWALIRAAGLDRLGSSTRPGVPDEPLCSFSLTEGGRGHSAVIWRNDVGKDQRLGALVRRLGALIEAYTGQVPALR